MTLPIKILYHLDNSEIVLLETKRLDRPEEKDKSKFYYWLLFRKLSGEMEKQDFVSMKSESEHEERIFRQGKLNFNADSGWYETEKTKYTFKNLSTQSLPEKTGKMISAFLTGLPE